MGVTSMGDRIWLNPYEKKGVWMKGNLYTHTTNSFGCGRYPIEEVLKFYAESGYGFTQGSFYFSSGLEFEEICVMDDEIKVSCKYEACFDFIGKDGMKMGSVCGREGSYRYQGNEHYIRVKATHEDGSMAWTQPFYICAEL